MSRTILIAAEDLSILYLLQRYAEESGFRALRAGPGADVIALAAEVQPAAIILETGPAGSADRKVVRGLKARLETSRLPVLVYSWLGEEACPQLDGVAGYLQPSVMYDDFLAALRRAGVLATTVEAASSS